MTFQKDGIPISSLGEWEQLAGPKSKGQWVDGRSAKETARAWLEGGGERLPDEVIAALATNSYFGEVLSWQAEPEAKFRFDTFAGEPRNSDLSINAIDKFGHYLITVEAKADESFGETVAKTLISATRRLSENPRSNGLNRLNQLRRSILGTEPDQPGQDDNIRYQLITACAGTIAEAERLDYRRAVMLIHEFVTDKTEDKKHGRNADDLNTFVSRLSCGEFSKLEPGILYGPLRTLRHLKPDKKVDLFIGKVIRNIRTTNG